MELWRAGKIAIISEEQGNTGRILNDNREHISKHLVTEHFIFFGNKLNNLRGGWQENK